MMRSGRSGAAERPVSVASMGVGYVDASQLTDLGRLTGAELAARIPRFAGRHFWVVSMVHSVADPEQALDDMVLGTDNLIGFEAIHCLFCSVRYPEGRRDPCHPSI